MSEAVPSAWRSALAWGASIGVTAGGLGVASTLRWVAPERSLRLVHRTCSLCHRIFGLDLRRRDLNRGGIDDGYHRPPYVFVYLNQTSLVETFILPWMTPRPYRIIVNIEYVLLPIFGWASLGLGARVVVRQWPAQAKRAIRRAVADLRRGGTYVISIEGRRSPDGALLPYKKGAVVLAIESGATIIPVVLHGARDRLPYGTWRVRPGPIEVVYLEGIATAGMTYDDRDAVLARLRGLAEAELAHEAGSYCGRTE